MKLNVLISPIAQVCFAGLLAVATAGMVRGIIRSPNRAMTSVLCLSSLATLVAAGVWSLGVVLVRVEYWPIPRTMAHVGILWAACLVLAAGAATGRWVRGGLAVLATTILFSFVAVNQAILDDQLRLNVRDLAKANRMIAHMEGLPGFESVRRIAFVGLQWRYPEGVMPTHWADLNLSAFGAPWSQVPLLREASGYDLRWATDPGEKAAAKEYCSTAPVAT